MYDVFYLIQDSLSILKIEKPIAGLEDETLNGFDVGMQAAYYLQLVPVFKYLGGCLKVPKEDKMNKVMFSSKKHVVRGGKHTMSLPVPQNHAHSTFLGVVRDFN